MNISNRRVDKKDLTFFQWLNTCEAICKREFKELPKDKQEDLKREFETFKNNLQST